MARFKRLSFPGVRRVIRRQQGAALGANGIQEEANVARPAPHVDLPPLGDLAGQDVVHTSRARSIYCLQTLQWACGMPIGWGKCYKSESQPQVLAIMDKTWESDPARRPPFIAYDDACDLLRHIVTQHPDSPWRRCMALCRTSYDRRLLSRALQTSTCEWKSAGSRKGRNGRQRTCTPY